MPEALTVKRAGIAWAQDLGRPGASKYGLAVNGALDQYSAMAANALTGNPMSATFVEIVAMPSAFVVPIDTLVAVTGAPAEVQVNGEPRRQWTPIYVTAGDKVSISNITAGLRCYFAVRGGISAPTLLGSCAPDTVVGFGRRLVSGDRLELGRAAEPASTGVLLLAAGRVQAEVPQFTDPWIVGVTEGPDASAFGASVDDLYSHEYVVTPASDHIGLRLVGKVPKRTSPGEILSRGVPVGAVEVPVGEELLVLHRGRGVTAGYPVPAVATSVGLTQLGQARPGQRIRFQRRTVSQAVNQQRRRQASLQRTLADVRLILGTRSAELIARALS